MRRGEGGLCARQGAREERGHHSGQAGAEGKPARPPRPGGPWSHPGKKGHGHQAKERDRPRGTQAGRERSLHPLPLGVTPTPRAGEQSGRQQLCRDNPQGHVTPGPTHSQGRLPQEASNHPPALIKLPRYWLISDYLPWILLLEHEFSKNRTLSVYLSIPCA